MSKYPSVKKVIKPDNDMVIIPFTEPPVTEEEQKKEYERWKRGEVKPGDWVKAPRYGNDTLSAMKQTTGILQATVYMGDTPWFRIYNELQGFALVPVDGTTVETFYGNILCSVE